MVLTTLCRVKVNIPCLYWSLLWSLLIYKNCHQSPSILHLWKLNNLVMEYRLGLPILASNYKQAIILYNFSFPENGSLKVFPNKDKHVPNGTLSELGCRGPLLAAVSIKRALSKLPPLPESWNYVEWAMSYTFILFQLIC